MNGLPHLLSPLAGAIAAALAVPTLLILYFLKLRRREMAVSSTFLWKKSVQDLQVNSPFQRLRKNLLLLLQLLVLLALILALSRPVANYTPGAGKLSVILIDRSASMGATDMPGGKTRLDEAKRQARDLVAGMDRASQATVIAFDDEPEIMHGYTSDSAALKTAIDKITATDRPTKLSGAFRFAQARAVLYEGTASSAKPEVWLYSDGRVSDAGDLRLDGDLKYQRIGTDTAGNVAIVAVDARRDYDLPTQVQVFARLANYGDKPVTADVRLSVDGVSQKVSTVLLAPERWSDAAWVAKHPGAKDETVAPRNSVSFNFEMQQAGIVKVEQMNKTNDALPADDVAQVVVPPPKALAVLLVTSAHDNPYLERAVRSMGLKDTKVMLSEDYEDAKDKEDVTRFDVIMFDRYYPQWLPPAGNFVYFGCAPTDGKLHVVKSGETYQTLKEVPVLDWRREHPILRHVSLNSLYTASMLRLAVPPDATTLVDGVKGPMIVLDREGRTTTMVVAFDILQSTWPIRPSFPLFIHNALQYLALGSDMNVRPSFPPGSTPRVMRATIAKLGPDVKSISLVHPDGSSEKVAVPATGDFVFPALNRVGVYKTDPPVPQFEQIAVNLLDENESNLLPVDTPPGSVGTAVATVAGGKSRLELWWWLVAAGAIPLLMIEWFVYTRRVHL